MKSVSSFSSIDFICIFILCVKSCLLSFPLGGGHEIYNFSSPYTTDATPPTAVAQSARAYTSHAEVSVFESQPRQT